MHFAKLMSVLGSRDGREIVLEIETLARRRPCSTAIATASITEEVTHYPLRATAGEEPVASAIGG